MGNEGRADGATEEQQTCRSNDRGVHDMAVVCGKGNEMINHGRVN